MSQADPRVRGLVDLRKANLATRVNLQTARGRDNSPPGRSEVPLTLPGTTHLGILHLNLVAQPEEGRS